MSLEKVDSLEVRPMMNNKPLPLGELVGDALSIISLKNLDDPDDPESVVKRNSFRDLHRPNISHLNWVVQSDGKEEVDRNYCTDSNKRNEKIFLTLKTCFYEKINIKNVCKRLLPLCSIVC